MTTSVPLSLLQITDLHILPNAGEKMLGVDTDFYFEAVLKHAFARRNRYDLILVTGDLTQDPCPDAYRRIFDLLNSYRTECICLPGNHDDYGMMLQYLNSDAVSCAKQRLFKNWQILCLNSQIPGKAGGNLGTNELSFLENALQQNPELFTLIAVHHHCLPTRSSWMDTMIIKNHEEFLEMTARFRQIKVITTGHIHQEMDINLQAQRILGTPSTCFQFKPFCSQFTLDDLMPGYRIIDLYSDGRIDTEIQRLPGTLRELDMNCSEY